jgi:hypothetical protein
MSRKTIEVDSDMIDRTLEELAKLILRLDKAPKKTRKEHNTIKKIQEVRDTLQDSVLYAKLKKSVQ